jgi:hypothetical protein
MTQPEALRAIRLALEQHKDGADFRAAVKAILRELDTPSMFPEEPRSPRNGQRLTRA